MFQVMVIKQLLKILLRAIGVSLAGELQAQLTEWGKDFGPVKVADLALDWVEDRVIGSASKIDDALVLPLCKMLRLTFDIPDNDAEHPQLE